MNNHRPITCPSFCAVLAAWLLLILPQASYAASQGSLGATSTATFVITVKIPETHRISNMDDLDFGEWSGHGKLEADDDICVYDNSSNGRYKYTITDNSSMLPGGFAVQNASGTAYVPYIVRWNNGTGTNGNTKVNYNQTKTGQNANTQSIDCSVGGNSANLLVRFTKAELDAAPGGFYGATLTVFVEP